MLPKQKAETRVMMFTMYVSVAAVLAFCEAERRPDALGKKGPGKDELRRSDGASRG